MPLPPRRVHEYLRATEPVAVDVTLLTVADRLSARGSGPFASRGGGRGPPRRWPARCSPPPSTGAATARRSRSCAATSWPPSSASSRGPELGELLAELEAAQYAGEVGTREEAVAWARGLRG